MSGIESDVDKPLLYYSFGSISDALNFSSSNTVLYVTTDVELFLAILLEGLENITIIGESNCTI